jgi:hypothetical protein
MNRKYLRGLTLIAGSLLTLSCVAPAHALERSLLGVHIYSSFRSVLEKYGNPTYVLTGGQSVTEMTGSNSILGGSNSAYGSISPLPPLQPQQSPQVQMQQSPQFQPQQSPQSQNSYVQAQQTPGYQGQAETQGMQGSSPGYFGGQADGGRGNGGPVSAFGMGGDNAPGPTTPQISDQTTANNGEVTLVFKKGSGVTYQFLLAPTGSVIQITALGYNDPTIRTARNITFGSSYTEVEGKYGYPENQSNINGVEVLDYTHRAHVAFELVNQEVIGIVVAAVD